MDIIEEAMQALKFHKAKVAEYEAFLHTAEVLAAEMLASRGNGTAQTQTPEQPKIRFRKKVSAKQRIGLGTREILSSAKFMHTRDLLEELGKRGIEVGGKNKIINLSGIPGRNGEFKSDRKKGWSLKKKGPEDAVTSPKPRMRLRKSLTQSPVAGSHPER